MKGRMTTAIVFAALFLLPLLPGAQAAPPEGRPWGSYNAISEIAAIAIAREGTTMAAALRPAVSAPTPGGVPTLPGSGAANIADTDLAILDYQYGFARNGSVLASTAPGRTHVVVSRDGTTVATLGLDTNVAGAPAAAARYKLAYVRVPPGGNWSGSPAFERTIDIGDPAATTLAGLVLSDDGRRVAIAFGQGTDAFLRGYSFSGASLDSAFEHRVTGTPRALAGSGDISKLLLVGQFADGDQRHGGGQLYPFAQQNAHSVWLDRAGNGTDAASGAISRDGRVITIGGSDGLLRVFRDVANTLDAPAAIRVGSAPLQNLTMSEDGSRAAVALGLTLTNLDLAAPTPIVRWNTTLTGQNLTGLAMNATGGLLVAGTSGTGGGVHGFGDAGNTPIWTIPGDTRAVAIDSSGNRIAYGQRVIVGAAQIARTITLDLATGGKVAPRTIVPSPGETTVALRLENRGAATETIVLEDTSPDVTIRTDPPALLVRPGETMLVNATVVIGESLSGPRVFNVAARAITSGAIDNVTLDVAPRPTLAVDLHLNGTDITAEPGRTSEVLLTIFNNGTADATVQIDATQTVSSGTLWDLSIGEREITVLRGTRASVNVRMTPPAEVVNGTSSTVLFTMRGHDIFDTATVVYRINPELEVQIEAIALTRLLEPGTKGFYNVTVTNTGSIPRDFDVFSRILTTDDRAWAIDMPAQVVRLEPLQSRVFPVTIVAPADALPEERVSVRITARSIPERDNDTVVTEGVTLWGIAIAPKITTTTTPAGIPFPTMLAVLVTVLLVFRSRRCPP